MSITPENILADNQNTANVNGETVRKGTVAAFMANIALYESDTSSTETKQQAWQMLEALAPKIRALNMHHFVIWKNSDVQQLVISSTS